MRKGLVLKVTLMERSPENSQGIEKIGIVQKDKVKWWIDNIDSLSSLPMKEIVLVSHEDLGETIDGMFTSRETIATDFHFTERDELVAKFEELADKEVP